MEPIGKILIIDQLLSWRAVLDILLLSAGLFFLYRALVRLGTWKIAVGVLAALLFYLVAAFLDLKGIEWVFGNVSQVVVIALIVLFQPELRKVLEQAVSMKRSETGRHGKQVATIVEEAVLELARQRRGAIIVFPGKEPIRGWLSGGIKLEAEPSLPLLLSIFDPHSPGHDGALIIREGKFSRYGVRLPISETANLPESYGTRHHAAMGLSEKTDALVLVVSEERGAVSIFHQREYHQVGGSGKIAGLIVAHWKENASYGLRPSPGTNRRILVSQVLASIGLAVFFWSMLVVSEAEVLEKVVSVPVEYAATPPNLMMIGEKQEEVRLHLEGPKSGLDSVNPEELAVRIDLSSAVSGKQSFIVTEETLRLPREVNLRDATPDNLTVTLAEIVGQVLPVKPQVVGKPPKGVRIDSIKLDPSVVKVLLPAETGEGKTITLTTTPIYLESIYDSTRIFCKIIAPPSVQPLTGRWPDVEVTIEVERLSE